ncbi:LacI family DNA-binding transcriptional regulator [Radicibacter daui]|uniref:LacI family DNA-binding transcriptional regulator n=1 Tax=Radicibacter daui TaxID=3064829 RepID=UPI004046C0DA
MGEDGELRGSRARGATLLDVARLVGVSRATISNAFSRPERVRPELRERIHEAARSIGYLGPNPVGRMLRTGKMGSLGLVFHDALSYTVSDPVAIATVRGVAEACEAAGVDLTLISILNPEKGEQRIRQAAVDGFVLQCIETNSPLVELAVERGLPVVSIDNDVKGITGSVTIDDRAGSALAARHLLALGHRRIGILALEARSDDYEGSVDAGRVAAATFSVTRDRFAGYLGELSWAGIGFEDVVIEERVNTRSRGRNGMAALLARMPDLTAVLCMSDELALGALEHLRGAGLAVPAQVAVVGFDDNPYAAIAVPPLTTIRQPHVEKGRVAAEIALGLRPGGEPIILGTELIVRGSTVARPAAIKAGQG